MIESDTEPYAYLVDIIDQPRALRETLAQLEENPWAGRLEKLHEGRPLVLTGMGSSLWALLPLYQRLRDHDVACWWVETSELLATDRTHLRENALVIAASQSGASAEIVTLLAERGAGSTIVGITNTAGSPLHVGCDLAILTSAGPEATVSTKTYLTTLLAAQWLGDRLLRETTGGADDAIVACDLYLADLHSRVDRLREYVEDATALFILGRGRSLAAAGTAGLIVKESVRVVAEGMSGSYFRHGPLEMAAEPGVVVFAFAGAGRTRPLQERLVNDVNRIGGRAHLIASDAELPFDLPVIAEAWWPLVEILPIQLMTLAIAAGRGKRAGEFEHLTKVTTVE